MVSQKRAALDVVYNRLSKFSLHQRVGFVHDYNKDWKDIFEKVINVLDENHLSNTNTLNGLFSDISENIDLNLEKLDKIAKLLHTKTDFGLTLHKLYSGSKNDTSKYLDNLFQNFSDFESININNLNKMLENIESIIEFLKFDFKNYILYGRNDLSIFPEIEKKVIYNFIDIFLNKYNIYMENSGKKNELLLSETIEILSSELNLLTSFKINLKNKIITEIKKDTNLLLEFVETNLKLFFNKFKLENKKLEIEFNELVKQIENTYSKIDNKTYFLSNENYKNLAVLNELCVEIEKLKIFYFKYWSIFFKLKKYIKKTPLKDIIKVVYKASTISELISIINKKFPLLIDYTENSNIFIERVTLIIEELKIIIEESNKLDTFENYTFNKVSENNYEKINILKIDVIEDELLKIHNKSIILDIFENINTKIHIKLENINADLNIDEDISSESVYFKEIRDLFVMLTSKFEYNSNSKEYVDIIKNFDLINKTDLIENNYNFFINSIILCDIRINILKEISVFMEEIQANNFDDRLLSGENISLLIEEKSNKLDESENNLNLFLKKTSINLNNISYSSQNKLLKRNLNSLKEDFLYKEISIEELDILNKYLKKNIVDTFKISFLIEKTIKEKLLEFRAEIETNFSKIKQYDKMKLDLDFSEKKIIDYCLRVFGENEIELKKSKTAILNTFYLKWIDKIEGENQRILQNFSIESDMRVRTKELITQKKDLNIKYIINNLNKSIDDSKSLNRLGNDTTYKDMKYEASKKRKRMTLRKYVTEFHSKGLLNILPCWLVTPEVASAIFPLKEGLFDIVIFDEASQMFVEQGIPVLYRAKKVVIAGDDKQLQPNDLYRVKIEEDSENEDSDEYQDNSSLESKSLLDLAKVKYKSSTLTYHYRALFEELINFSNYAFYNGKIQITPNREDSSFDKPIERIKVDGRWIDRKNDEEAKEIVKLIKEILINRDYEETIGIITFNSTQKDLIIDLLDNEVQTDIEFRALYLKEINRKNGDEDVSLFVKNIENVQGDERDIIIFSIGYAKNEQGKVATRFGALNQEFGENRLNVAISRAKRKIYLITSIEPEELNVDSSKNIGPQLFKKYLQYARAVSDNNKDEIKSILNNVINKSMLGVNTLDFDSDFENQVYDELVKLGYEVHTQVGASGYRIDLCIYDRKKSEYILGIECDGAMYHSSKSARERDIYRQKFLESRGWKIHRIWSKNWWVNPKEEINKIEFLLNGNKKGYSNEIISDLTDLSIQEVE